MRWFNRFIQMPSFDTDDGGMAADGGADAGEDAGNAGEDAGEDATDGEGADGGDADDTEGHEGSQGHDDDDENALFGDDDAEDENRPIEERFKALKKANNKLRKRFGKAWPVVQTLKKLGITDVNDVVVGSRNWNALLERVGGDRNKLNRLLDSLDGEHLGGDRDTRSTTKSRGQDRDDDGDFDDKQFDTLWDTTTDAGKHFVQQARRVHEQSKTLKALQARIDQLEGGFRNDKESQVKQSWLTVINRDAKRIKDPDTREIYEDRMKSAFFVAKARNQHIDPEQLSTTTLKKLKIVTPTSTRIANAAGQQRMAHTNATRPRSMAGGGQAAPAKNKRETVDEVNRRIRRIG